MSNVRPRVLQDLLACPDYLKGCVWFRVVGRNAVDLLRIEDRINAMDKTRFLRVPVVGIGRG
jgi:hypothetical protein